MKLSVAGAVAALCLSGPAVAAKPPTPAPLVALTPSEADYRPVDPDNLLVVDTNKGRILVELAPFAAPQNVQRIKILARQHFYDGQKFFRVVDGFMDQTGDPTNTGEGGSKLPNIPGEFTFRRGEGSPFVPVAKHDDVVLGFDGSMPVVSQPDDLMLMTTDSKVLAWPQFCPGVLGMARSNDPDSANSQFFFMRAAYPTLEKKYTGFGRVLMGEDVVKSIKLGEPVADPQDFMITVRLASDLPPQDRPKLYVLDTRSAAFKAMADRIKADKGPEFSLCDVEVPAEIR